MNNLHLREFHHFEKFIQTVPLDNNYDEICIDIELLKSCNCKQKIYFDESYNEDLQNNIVKEDYIYLLQDRFKYYEKKISSLYFFIKKCIEWIYYWKNKYYTLVKILNENNIQLQTTL